MTLLIDLRIGLLRLLSSLYVTFPTSEPADHFHKIRYECFAIGSQTFSFFTLSNNNMMDTQTWKVKASSAI
jgi:hypothetical protein